MESIQNVLNVIKKDPFMALIELSNEYAVNLFGGNIALKILYRI